MVRIIPRMKSHAIVTKKGNRSMSTSSSHKAFHITIGTHPPSDLRLDSDVSLVKAAILYGDRAKLCSAASFTLLSTLAMANAKPKERIDLIEQLAPAMMQDKIELDKLLN